MFYILFLVYGRWKIYLNSFECQRIATELLVIWIQYSCNLIYVFQTLKIKIFIIIIFFLSKLFISNIWARYLEIGIFYTKYFHLKMGKFSWRCSHKQCINNNLINIPTSSIFSIYLRYWPLLLNYHEKY